MSRAWVKRVTMHRPEAAHPTYLGAPVSAPWRLVDEDGTMLTDGNGRSLRFETDDDALAFLRDEGIALLPPRL